MASNKKTLTIFSLLTIIIIATAATTSPFKYKNLQVLPKDISEKKLDSIMGAYTNALKVSCDFCHIPKKDMFAITPANAENDYASDNPMKEDARRMMRMTRDINKNYFPHDSITNPVYLNVVSCNTCHRGNPYPAHE